MTRFRICDSQEIMDLKYQAQKTREAIDIFDNKFYRFYEKHVFDSFKHSEDIPYKMMEHLKVGEKTSFPTVNDKWINSIRLRDRATNVLDFETTFDGEAILTKHHHSDCDEAVNVLKGGPFIITITLPDKTEIKEEIHEGGRMVLIKKNHKHQFTNMSKEDSTLSVKFLK